MPAGVVAADPGLIGEGSQGPRHTEPAGPVTLPVAPGTVVDAVTAGTLKVIAAGDGTATMVLSGSDGATYTYRDVATGDAAGDAAAADITAGDAEQEPAKVTAGQQIGVSGSAGLTFSISVPDVRGAVDVDEALQAWAAGLSVNVRSLPSTVAPDRAGAPARSTVLLVTDAGARATATDLAKSLTSQLVSVKTGTRITTTRGARLVIAVLADGTPARAAALAARLPRSQDMLWVDPPGTTARQAAAYRAIVAARPGFRAESLPAALATAPKPAGELATAALVTAYVATAYRLPAVSTQASTVVSWAEEQLGKPYLYAAAGPGSFDCSGLTMDALAQAGIAVPHNANLQWLQTGSARVTASELAPGDLVFFAGADGTLTAPGHVGIYVGDGDVIDAPYTGAKVRFDSIASIGGYVGATDPYAATPAGPGGTTAPATPSLAAPAELTQYESFAASLASATWGPGQFGYLYLLWERESGWNPAAVNPVSGAFGIPQALPAVKMASAGLDWATDPYTQIIWGIDYIRAAYGTPQAAWAHELADNWY